MYETLVFKHTNETDRTVSKDVHVVWSKVGENAVTIPQSQIEKWVEECIAQMIKTDEDVSYRISGDTCVLVMLEEVDEKSKFFSVEVCKRAYTAWTRV